MQWSFLLWSVIGSCPSWISQPLTDLLVTRYNHSREPNEGTLVGAMLVVTIGYRTSTNKRVLEHRDTIQMVYLTRLLKLSYFSPSCVEWISIKIHSPTLDYYFPTCAYYLHIPAALNFQSIVQTQWMHQIDSLFIREIPLSGWYYHHTYRYALV